MAKNYYLILGIGSGASHEEIRAAYRQLAKEYHPDHYGQDRAPFLEIQEAYAVLSDLGRKKVYDESIRRAKRTEIRDVTPQAFCGNNPTVEPLGPGDARPIEASLAKSFQMFGPSFDEIFDRLWSNFASLNRPKSEGLEKLTIEIPLESGQADRGGSVRVHVPARTVCPSCKGHGGIGYYECWRCAGEGQITGEYPVLVNFPAGVSDGHAVSIPLDRFGIHNLYLSVRFRIL